MAEGCTTFWKCGTRAFKQKLHPQACKANVAIVLADTPKYPLIAELTSDFVYLRLQDAKAEI
jgi:hypothetical protein